MDVARLSEAPVYLPGDTTDSVTDAWSCGRTPVFMFGDVQLSFESGYGNVTVPGKYHALARDYGGSVQTIQGISAYVYPAGGPKLNDEILMINGDTAIRLLARGDVPVDHLTEVAQQLDLRAPVTIAAHGGSQRPSIGR